MPQKEKKQLNKTEVTRVKEETKPQKLLEESETLTDQKVTIKNPREIRTVEPIKIDSEGKEIGNHEKKKISERFTAWFSKLSKFQKSGLVVIIIFVVVFLCGGGLLVFKALGLGKWQAKNPLDGKLESSNPVEAKTEAKDHESPLTGNLITKTTYDEIMKRRPLAIMVENHVDARPQSGLNDADIVWEAMAEGGITRFMPVFLEQEVDKVGPVRSVRNYYLDWLAEYRDGLIMHIGGAMSENLETNSIYNDASRNIVSYISKYDVKTLTYQSNTFWRVSNRLAPHNAYSSAKDLWSKAQGLGWTGLQDIEKWEFKDETTLETATVNKVTVNWQGWGATPYSVGWNYDSTRNRYLRDQNGVMHVDGDTGDQLFTKNVVLALYPSRFTVDADKKSRLIYTLTGEGDAKIFMDGKMIEGKWKKFDRISRTKFYDSEGTEISFNRGRTWIMALPVGSEINYSGQN